MQEQKHQEINKGSHENDQENFLAFKGQYYGNREPTQF